MKDDEEELGFFHGCLLACLVGVGFWVILFYMTHGIIDWLR